MIRRQLFLLILLVAAVPFVAADTIQLTTNNIGISGSIGSVILTQVGGNVQVTIKANSGFSFQLSSSNTVFFNTTASLTSGNIGPVTLVAGGTTYTGLSFADFKTNMDGGPYGKFSVVLGGLNAPAGITGGTQISFTISGVTVQQLELANSSGALWGVHFCVGSGTDCVNGTGFAIGTRATTVPEPGTLSLLGTGLLGIAGFVRRRLRA